jgi:hypothetical protein
MSCLEFADVYLDRPPRTAEAVERLADTAHVDESVLPFDRPSSRSGRAFPDKQFGKFDPRQAHKLEY